ncbi:hypothetical protein OF83DRAFT_321579 [Amylostereum chailletii]|nr:hypothetical protein OF83DRAFT_321579 [Amylostereum chailletii]
MADLSLLSPSSPSASYDGALSPTLVSSVPGSPRALPTRTVAIIKPHALEHRFDIEHRITEASFEIVKERQMEFDVESDPDTLFELFGEDARSFSEGPVWVYVLERRRAVEVWNTIMGDSDPAIALKVSPNSLRALYGTSEYHNAVMGSPDVETAEMQIASLFASSPPFPATDLPDDVPDIPAGSMRSISSSILSALRRKSRDAPSTRTTASTSYSPSQGKSAGSSSGKLTANGSNKPGFKARELPLTHDVPSIAPRSSRAADLRAGIIPEKPTERGPRTPLSKDKLVKIFANIPGHKRAESIAVASTAAPTIAPRMTRAASLRLGQTPIATPTRPRSSSGAETFEGVPGHKRRETIAVASTKAPTVGPRLNKSAALRAQKDAAPPSSFMFRTPTATRTPSLSRTSSSTQLSTHSRPSSVQSLRPTPSRTLTAPSPTPARKSTTVVRPPSVPPKASPRTSTTTTTAKAEPPKPAPPRPRPSSLQMPTVAPRQNRSAMLRAAKAPPPAPAPLNQRPAFV